MFFLDGVTKGVPICLRREGGRFFEGGGKEKEGKKGEGEKERLFWRFTVTVMTQNPNQQVREREGEK